MTRIMRLREREGLTAKEVKLTVLNFCPGHYGIGPEHGDVDCKRAIIKSKVGNLTDTFKRACCEDCWGTCENGGECSGDCNC